MSQSDLKTTPFYDLHVRLGAKMVPFAGYAMPVQYSNGVKAEHLHTRAKAGLFDVAHMGQLLLDGEGASAALEKLVVGNIQGLAIKSMRYTLLTNGDGGILDDLIVTKWRDHLHLVVNAARKDQDFQHLQENLDCPIRVLEDRALLALQGPLAEPVLGTLAPGVTELGFMKANTFEIMGTQCLVTRSGYTGEDGFEISIPSASAMKIAEMLLDHPAVQPIGLGARDSLRLEAGLCLYGKDLGPDTTPIEAALEWAIGKNRREVGGFPGDHIILKQLAEGAPRRRVGIRPDGRAPTRENTHVTDSDGNRIGEITSGGFGPSVNGPIAMGYVDTASSLIGTKINALVRGKPLATTVVDLPFVKAKQKRS